MQRAALHAAAEAVSVENITVKSAPKKAVFVTACTGLLIHSKG
jgi:hypothetical protein